MSLQRIAHVPFGVYDIWIPHIIGPERLVRQCDWLRIEGRGRLSWKQYLVREKTKTQEDDGRVESVSKVYYTAGRIAGHEVVVVEFGVATKVGGDDQIVGHREGQTKESGGRQGSRRNLNTHRGLC